MSRSALEKKYFRHQQQQHQARLNNAPPPIPPSVPVTAGYHMAGMPAAYAAAYAYQNMYAMYQGMPGIMPGTVPDMSAMAMSGAAGLMPAMPMVDPNMAGAAGYAVPAGGEGEEEEYEDPNDKSNTINVQCNSTYNINTLLYNNILESDYFRALYQLRTYHEVLDEIQRTVKHVEPWQTGTSRKPSSAFCLLLKFMTMKLTVKQMNGLLAEKSGPQARAIGFLYLRYICPPNDLWKWYEPYLEETTEITPASSKTSKVTVGEFCIKLLTDMNYFGTTLPRIPVPIERKFKVLLLLLEDKKKRRAQNLKWKEKGVFQEGCKVKAIWSDEQNEPAWYEAVIDSIDEEDDNKFWVTFTEYGNNDCVDLGNMELIDVPKEKEERNHSERNHTSERSRSRDDNRKRDRRDDSRDRRRRDSRSRSRSPKPKYDNRRRSRSRSHDRDQHHRAEDSKNTSSKNISTNDLLAQVLKQEREASAAVGKQYAQKVTTYKNSLSLKADTYGVRKRSPSRDRYRDSRDSQRYQRRRSRTPSPPSNTASSNTSKPKNDDQLRLLRERYGDASTQNNKDQY